MEKSKSNKTEYQCVGCHFYDKIEAFATLKSKVSIAYDDNGDTKTLITIVTNLKTINQQEFLITEANTEIRLDYIISIIEL